MSLMILARIIIPYAQAVEAKILTHIMMLSAGCAKTVPTDSLYSSETPYGFIGRGGYDFREG
jgi:hypothetical protein